MAKRTRPANKTPPKPYQVFVSHATADKWIAKVICEKIEARGVTTFRDDRDIDGGDDIPDEILRQIKRSKEIVVFLTPQSENRPWINLEVGAAWALQQRIRIIPVLCHLAVDVIPDMLKRKKAIPLNDFDNYLNELTTRVRSYHGSFS